MSAMRLLPLLILLAGCGSYADRVAASCERFGAGRGSPHYWDCVQQQQAIDQRDRAMWGRTTGVGAALLAPRPSPTLILLPRY